MIVMPVTLSRVRVGLRQCLAMIHRDKVFRFELLMSLSDSALPGLLVSTASMTAQRVQPDNLPQPECGAASSP